MLRGASFNQKKDRSLLTDVAAFDDNATVTSYITYDSKIGKTYNKVTTAKLVRSLALLPETPMRPRLADFRLPLNVLGKYNYHSGLQADEPRHFRHPLAHGAVGPGGLRPGRSRGLKAPVVFYIDTTFTAQMSAAITKGILEWNKCFEAIGFKNAIRVRPFPHARRGPAVQPPELPLQLHQLRAFAHGRHPRAHLRRSPQRRDSPHDGHGLPQHDVGDAVRDLRLHGARRSVGAPGATCPIARSSNTSRTTSRGSPALTASACHTT